MLNDFKDSVVTLYHCEKNIKACGSTLIERITVSMRNQGGRGEYKDSILNGK